MVRYPPRISKPVSYPREFEVYGALRKQGVNDSNLLISPVCGMKACWGYGNKFLRKVK